MIRNLHLRQSVHLLLAAVLLTGATIAISARTAAQTERVAVSSAEPAPPPAKKRREVHYFGKTGTRVLTPAGQLITLAGAVVFRSEDTVLHTDVARYNDTTKIATSPGRLQIDDAQNTIIGDTGVAFYKTRDAKINGKVKIIVRPKPSDQNAPEGSARREFKEPATISCDQVVYNWRTRKAIATGNLTLRQKNRTVTADKGLYDGRTETVTLIGNVRYRTDDGEHSNGSRAIAVLKEGAESFRMESEPGKPIEGVMHIDDDDDATPLAKPGTANTTDTPAPTDSPATSADTPPAPVTPLPVSPAPASSTPRP